MGIFRLMFKGDVYYLTNFEFTYCMRELVEPVKKRRTRQAIYFLEQKMIREEVNLFSE